MSIMLYVRLRHLSVVILGIFLINVAFSQELPPIKAYTAQDYNAGNQNWSIAQSNDETIYVANNKGLLEFNGARWELYANEEQTIMRSVAVIDDKVYTGSYMDFGYWERNTFGKLEYTSLSKALELKLIQDEEFWSIIPLENWLLFQSFDRIYIYDTITKNTRIIESEYRITKMFKVNGVIYFQRYGQGIYKIQNGVDVLVTDNDLVKNQEVINIFMEDGVLLVHLREDGFYLVKDGRLQKWQIKASKLLSSISSYSSIRLRNGNFIIGTISNGVLTIDKSGELLFQMNQINGLANNTILSAFQDITGNIWLGLDNGINVLNLDSPYRVYKDNQGKLGTIYASAITDEFLYLGTNQGLFYRPNNSNGNFNLIEGTEGQVWVLRKINGQLFCGHDAGTFQIVDNKAFKIAPIKGTWDIKRIEGYPNLLIQGNYKGLSILEKSINNRWVWKHKIDGFDISSRYFEFVNSHKLLVSHEYKGVYEIRLNDDFTKVTHYKKDSIGKGIGSSLFKYKNNLYYAFQNGIYRYKTNTFEKDSLLADYFSKDNYVSGKLIYNDHKKTLWVFLKNQMVYLEPGKLSEQPIINSIDLPSNLRKSKSGFENIIHLKKNSYLFGTTEGYLIIDLDKFKPKEYTIAIDQAMYNTINTDQQYLSLNSKPELNNNQNNISLSFSVPDFSSLYPSSYQYRLVGIYDDWSNWSDKSTVVFENLPHGNYIFEVRGKVGGNVSSNVARYEFTIKKPWFVRPLAIVGYVLLLVLIIALIQYLNRSYYKKQKKKLLEEKEREMELKQLESKRRLTEFKNKNLQQDIDNKNRELGLSTMNLIRKNEFLNMVKKELSNIEHVKELGKVVKIIDKNINNTDDWKYFQEAFNNADKDFLKKIKTLHPSLTPNDLKLCAYLRLNLSSKEIAPLLNISHRSVEVKRYRLRKKMKLPHEANLTSYILEI